jgi:hypothetical protein
VLCVRSSQWEVPSTGKGDRWSAGGNIPGAASSLGASGPVMCRLSPWMLLVTAPEAVVGRLLGSVSPGTLIDRCGRPSRCGRPTPVSCDAPTELGDA